MDRLTHAAMRASLETALSMDTTTTNHLSQDTFSASYPSRPDWAIGPFERDDSLTFRPEGQWDDPTDIGWASTSIFNPSLIEHDGALVLFYRASPRMETTSSRIGMARWKDGVWTDSPVNPTIYPTRDNEALGCEDPKIYRADGRYYLFYNGIFEISGADRAALPSAGYPVETVGCDINLAVSDDLVSWEKRGPILGHDISRRWAKGAVIPRDPNGNAVRIGGDYLMYISEGCNGVPTIGRSTNMVDWEFEAQAYLDLSELGGSLHEVACATTGHSGSELVLDFFYSDADGQFAAAQALYDTSAPFDQLAINPGGSLSWGGLLQRDGTWLFAQGWDAPRGTRELYFYRGQLS
jgi:hypothetical protein